jgi:hypothetical protein
MKPRRNVQYSIGKNGIIDIYDNFITVYSKLQIHRHGSPDEIFINYGDEYWSVNMDSCRRCLQSESAPANRILYCDLKNCNQSFHLLCLQNQDSSQLRQSPWFCPACVKMNEEVTVDVGLIITSEERKQSLYFARPSRAASAVTQRRHHPSKRKIDEQEDRTQDEDVIDLTLQYTSSSSSSTSSSSSLPLVLSSSSTYSKRKKTNKTLDESQLSIFQPQRISSSSSSSATSSPARPLLRSSFTPDDAIQIPAWSPAVRQLPLALAAKVNNSPK